MLINNPVFHPHSWQAKILLSPAKRKVVLCGRQSGKTTLNKQVIYHQALQFDNQEILVTAPTHGSVKELLWRPFTKNDDPLFHPSLIEYQNNSDMVIELINGSRISFKGTENIDALLGRELDLLLHDEWQSQKEDVWTYLEPMLATRQGTAYFTGTARRGNHIMDFYARGQSMKYWKSWLITTPDSHSPAGEPEAIKIAQSSMSEEEYNQEYLCIPALGEGLVYPTFSNNNIVGNKPLPTDKLLHIGVDFNVANMNAVIFVREGNHIEAVDEIQLKHSKANTHSLMSEIKRRYSNYNVVLYPDASGRNRSTNTVDVNNTNHQLLRTAGYNLVFSHSGNPPREDRTILINSKIKAMDGNITFTVQERCKNLINSLQKRQFKNGLPEKDNITDHGCDCMDYVIWHLFANVNKVSQYSGSSSGEAKPLVASLIAGQGTTPGNRHASR